MGLFGFGRKKEEVKEGCCCGSAGENKAYVAEKGCCACGENRCCIKVLGTGCKLCHEQYENVKKAVAEMNLDAEIEYITDMEKIMDYGVMSMPAIVVNDQVVSMGKVLKVSQVAELLKKPDC